MYFGLNDNCPYSHANLGSQWVALFGEGLGGVPLSEDVLYPCQKMPLGDVLVFKVYAIFT